MCVPFVDPLTCFGRQLLHNSNQLPYVVVSSGFFCFAKKLVSTTWKQLAVAKKKKKYNWSITKFCRAHLSKPFERIRHLTLNFFLNYGSNQIILFRIVRYYQMTNHRIKTVLILSTDMSER